jgi:hypothetical protein
MPGFSLKASFPGLPAERAEFGRRNAMARHEIVLELLILQGRNLAHMVSGFPKRCRKASARDLPKTASDEGRLIGLIDYDAGTPGAGDLLQASSNEANLAGSICSYWL